MPRALPAAFTKDKPAKLVHFRRSMVKEQFRSSGVHQPKAILAALERDSPGRGAARILLQEI